MDCGICVANFDQEKRKPLSLSCGHTVCETCFKKWKQTHELCPFCRQKISGIPNINYYVFGMLEKVNITELKEKKTKEIDLAAVLKKDLHLGMYENNHQKFVWLPSIKMDMH